MQYNVYLWQILIMVKDLISTPNMLTEQHLKLCKYRTLWIFVNSDQHDGTLSVSYV